MVGFVVRNAVMASCAAAAMAALAAPAVAADLTAPAPYVVPAAPVILPANYNAVSTVNAKFDIAGGYEWGDKFSNHALGKISGAIAFPIGPEFGVQIDASAAATRGDWVGALGGHAFWRNPSIGLLGIYADGFTTQVPRGSLNVARLGVEGEYYFDRFRLSGIAGVESGDRTKSRAFVDALASWYVQDDLRLYAGYSNTFAGSQGRAGLEYQLPPSSGWGNFALFGEGRIGEHGYASVLGGVRVYFGESKSLWRRHREDDPEIWSNENYAAASQAVSGGTFDKKKKNNKPTCIKADRPCKPE